jgi:hypothetical protein
MSSCIFFFNCINPPITTFSISLTSLHICIVALPAFQPLPGRSEARCHLAMADQSIGRMGACPGCCGLGVACLNPWPVMFVLLLFLVLTKGYVWVGLAVTLRTESIGEGDSVPGKKKPRGKKAKQ